MCLICLLLYFMSTKHRDGPKLSLACIIFHYIELHWNDYLLPRSQSSGKTRHAPALSSPTKSQSENMCMRQWPALGQREIVQFI